MFCFDGAAPTYCDALLLPPIGRPLLDGAAPIDGNCWSLGMKLLDREDGGLSATGGFPHAMGFVQRAGELNVYVYTSDVGELYYYL